MNAGSFDGAQRAIVQTNSAAQPEVLWEFAEVLSGAASFKGQRMHLLVDEYDNLSERQQRILNTYLRKRDFPLTFQDRLQEASAGYRRHPQPSLQPSGDFTQVQLDDEDLGLGGTSRPM